MSHEPSKSEPLKGFANFGSGLLYLSGALLVVLTAYLLWSNPEYNESLRVEQLSGTGAGEWTYQQFSGINTKEDNYPLVVLRTGFKLIRTGLDKSLVGWKYEIANTSPKTRYVPTVNFILQDEDGFDIAESSGETIVQPASYGIISGMVLIDNIDIDRLHGSSWTIRLSPDWEVAEKSTRKTRLDRLESIAEQTMPQWAREFAKDEVDAVLSDKWKAIRNGLGFTQHDADSGSNE